MLPILITSLLCISSPQIGEAEVVATCLVLEAGGESQVGIQAVFNVIQNRSKKKDMSMRDVVLAKYQFSCFNSYTVSQKESLQQIVDRAKKHERFDWCLNMAKNATEFKDITKGATHYHVYKGPSKVTPYWTHTSLGGKNDKATITVKIGNHVFLIVD